MTVYTEMLPKQPADEHQTEELESNNQDEAKTVTTLYVTFHEHFENVYKRQKISDDSQGNKLYGKFNLTFDRLSCNSV